MIPDEIRTGFGLESDMCQGEAMDELQRKITSIMLVLMKRSLNTAAIYIVHRGETQVQAEHISKGIKLEATTFFDSDGLEDETDEMREWIFGDETQDMIMCDDDDSEGISSSESDDDTIRIIRDDDLDPEKATMVNTFIDAVGETFDSVGDIMARKTDVDTCVCEICSKMDAIDEVWDAWDISGDPIKAFLKQHVEKTDQMVHDQLIDQQK